MLGQRDIRLTRGPASTLALRNLSIDRVRLGLSVSGVAVSVMLVLLLRGYLDGAYQQASAYFDHTPGQLVVAQTGTRNTISSASVVSDEAVQTVRGTPGVARAIPVLEAFAVLELHGRKQFAFAVGYDPQIGGGPWSVSSGREPRTGGELVIDRLLADEHEIGLGDRIVILGEPFTVVGLADGTTFWIGTWAFMTKAALEELTRQPGATSFVFVTVADGADEAAVRQRLDDVPGVTALPRDELIENQRRVLGRIYEAPLGLMVAIAYGIGILVVGLVIYSATIERAREYGVLKAIGGSNWVLYRVIVGQALVASIAGAVVGVGLGYASATALELLRPQFNVVIEPAAVAVVLAGSLAMALAGALVPARAIARLAPSEVFRS